MTTFQRLHRHIDPGSTLGEIMFGAIMVLTFTIGARLLGADEPTDGRELMHAAIGCNIAWGIIDAFLYLLGVGFERRHSGGAEPIGLTMTDFRAAALIFVLVVLTAVPAVLPFLFLTDSYVALRVSNALMTLLLFAVGYRWGKHVGARPVLSGLLVMSIGIVLVLVAIPLGG
jgi:VIT1/CCC1 family predicted Fe2+/Mn2+ transporter